MKILKNQRNSIKKTKVRKTNYIANNLPILWEHTGDVPVGQFIRKTPKGDPGTVFVLGVPGYLMGHTKLDLTCIQLIDQLHFS